MDILKWGSRITMCLVILLAAIILRIFMKLTVIASAILGIGFLVSWVIGLGMGGMIRQELDQTVYAPTEPSTVVQ